MAHFHKLSVIYHAPEGDSKVVEMMNTTFFDGQPVDVVCSMEDEARLDNNPHFEIASSTDYDPGDKFANAPPEGGLPAGRAGKDEKAKK